MWLNYISVCLIFTFRNICRSVEEWVEVWRMWSQISDLWPLLGFVSSYTKGKISEMAKQENFNQFSCSWENQMAFPMKYSCLMKRYTSWRTSSVLHGGWPLIQKVNRNNLIPDKIWRKPFIWAVNSWYLKVKIQPKLLIS